MIQTNQTALRSLPTTANAPKLQPTPTLPENPTVQPQDGVQLSPAPVEAPKQEVAVEPPVLKEPTGEMAEMLENMQAAEERLKIANNDLRQGVLQDLWAQAGSASPGMAILDEGAAPPEYNQNIDGFLALLVADEVKHSPDASAAGQAAHGKHPKEHHGLLGGHLGIEGTEHVAHEVMSAKAHAVETVHGVASSGAGDVLDAAVTSGKHVAGQHAADAADSAHHAGEVGVHHAAEGAAEGAGHAMSGFMAGLTGALAAGSGALGVVMLHLGIKGIKHGVKEKNVEHTLEGVNSTLVGTRSIAAGTSMAGHLIHGSEVLSTIAGVAKSTLTPLGVVHGAIDTGLGAKQLWEGKQAGDTGKMVKGGLGMGLGLSLIGAAVGGGIPAIVAAGVFLTGKVVHGIRQSRAQAEEQSSLPPEQNSLPK